MTPSLKRTRARAASAAAVFLLTAFPVLAQQPQKPPPPPDEWKGTNFVTAYGASVSARGDPFDPAAHGAMTPQGEICSNELNSAIYRQDVLHAFESKAHFDNCAFEESAEYVSVLIAEARDHIARIQGGGSGNDVPAGLRQAMLAFGQALHGIQDFYAHTNYVELMQMRSPGMTDEAAISILEFWRPAGREQLRKLAASGLHSGQVWWSLPHVCESSVPSHGDLAKDSPDTKSGKQSSIFKHALTGRFLSNHTVAFNLASRATREFLRWAGQTYPQIERFCGQTLRYNVQPDRRAAD
jgi:hypothetical protein